MKTIIGAILAMLLALAVTEVQQNSTATERDTTDKTLLANERTLYDAVAKADKLAFQSLVLPEGIWTTPLGFTPMNLLADALDDFHIPTWAIENPHVIWSDDNSALLLYSRTGGGTVGEQRFAAVSLASTLWTKRSGKWIAVHHQETDLIKN
jgi:hypothetical protein